MPGLDATGLRRYPDTGILTGAPVSADGAGKGLYNGAFLIHDGRTTAVRYKSLLPTYDVFDETCYFETAPEVMPVSFKSERIGISVCEDAWNDPVLWPGNRMYSFNPIEALAQKGATIIINISASPFTIGKEEIRYRLISNHAKEHDVPFLYVNQVGGNDELLFDGRSMFVDRNGEPVWMFPSFIECVEMVDTEKSGGKSTFVPQDKIETVYMALRLGVRDYLKKCGFSKTVLGLSGGIDSAVTAVVACDALGKENMLGIAMPSRYSSEGSVNDPVEPATQRNL